MFQLLEKKWPKNGCQRSILQLLRTGTGMQIITRQQCFSCLLHSLQLGGVAWFQARYNALPRVGWQLPSGCAQQLVKQSTHTTALFGGVAEKKGFLRHTTTTTIRATCSSCFNQEGMCQQRLVGVHQHCWYITHLHAVHYHLSDGSC